MKFTTINSYIKSFKYLSLTFKYFENLSLKILKIGHIKENFVIKSSHCFYFHVSLIWIVFWKAQVFWTF